MAIPKTMDNDVPGTDYCIGFSTCVTRTIELTHELRTSAGSHERFLVLEVFGRYAGFTALLPTMAGAADRCVIPEHPFDMEHLAELLSLGPQPQSEQLLGGADFRGRHMAHEEEMTFEGEETDQYGHSKLGGIGDKVAAQLKELSPKFNGGRRVNVLNQRLGYLVRCGDPDALDSIVPMAFGNLALDLVLADASGRLVCIHNGCYDTVPIEVVTGHKKVVDVEKYLPGRPAAAQVRDVLRASPLFIMTRRILDRKQRRPWTIL